MNINNIKFTAHYESQVIRQLYFYTLLEKLYRFPRHLKTLGLIANCLFDRHIKRRPTLDDQ